MCFVRHEAECDTLKDEDGNPGGIELVRPLYVLVMVGCYQYAQRKSSVVVTKHKNIPGTGSVVPGQICLARDVISLRESLTCRHPSLHRDSGRSCDGRAQQ